MALDLWQGLPIDGRDYRQEVNSYFTKQRLELIASAETKKLVEYFREIDENKYKNQYEKAPARVLIEQYDDVMEIPIDLQLEMSNFTAKAQMVWKEALKNTDFDLYKPYMKEMFELKAKVTQAIDNTKEPFDALVSSVDVGMTVEKINQLFGELKAAIVSILSEIREKHASIDTSCLDISLDKDKIRKIGTHIVESTFFDKNKATYWEVIHPVCACVGPTDVRITTYFHDLLPSIFSILHECGHGVYHYSSNPKVVEHCLWGDIQGAMHESQARFYENIIGKSKEFWQHFYPFLQDEIEELRKFTLEEFYMAINKAQPSLKRLEADELTYSLHPIIRFEMENDYFAGKLKIDNFEEVWNAKYKDYLGIEPKNAREGVL